MKTKSNLYKLKMRFKLYTVMCNTHTIQECQAHATAVREHLNWEISTTKLQRNFTQGSERPGTTYCLLCGVDTTDAWRSYRSHHVFDKETGTFIPICTKFIFTPIDRETQSMTMHRGTTMTFSNNRAIQKINIPSNSLNDKNMFYVQNSSIQNPIHNHLQSFIANSNTSNGHYIAPTVSNSSSATIANDPPQSKSLLKGPQSDFRAREKITRPHTTNLRNDVEKTVFLPTNLSCSRENKENVLFDFPKRETGEGVSPFKRKAIGEDLYGVYV